MRAKQVKSSLFDVLLKELSYDLKIRDYKILSDEVVSYTSDRTGREAHMSYSRFTAINHLIPGLRKRYIGPTSELGPTAPERHLNAVAEFLSDNERCRQFNDLDFPRNCDDFSITVAGEVKGLLADSLDGLNGSCLNLSNVASKMHTGPGASTGLKPALAGDYSEYNKLCDGPMSFSHPDVAGAYKACILTTRLTAVSEAVRYRMYGELDSYHANAHFLSVPKTNSKNRGICTQPSGNMALQLATHEILSDTLRHTYGCNLSTQQELNKELALCGSTGKKGWLHDSWEFCTVDLSSASNFPWSLVEYLFPELWVRWLDMIRSPTMTVDGVDHVKHMCSSMGNGFTFSLMTLLFSAIVRVLYSLAGIPEYDVHPVMGKRKTWAVYGDDIIVDKRVFNALLKVLNAFGFTVNVDKTFSTGLFRESCGGDYYNGAPVRPVFLETLDTQADIYSLLNRLTQWGVTHSVDLVRGLTTLKSALGKDVLRVPNWEDVSAGLHVPFTLCDHKPMGVPKVIKELLNIGNVPYRTSECVNKKRSLFREKKKASRRIYYSDTSSRNLLYYDYSQVEVKDYTKNVPGMLLCMLGGSVRMGQYGLRLSTEIVRQEVWKIAPVWGDPTLFACSAVQLKQKLETSLDVYRLWEEYVKRCSSKNYRPLSILSSIE